jgi:hypothetical protein
MNLKSGCVSRRLAFLQLDIAQSHSEAMYATESV